MNFTPELIILIGLFLWTLTLTVLFLNFYFTYSKVVKKGKDGSVLPTIESAIENLDKNNKRLDEIYVKYDTLYESGLSHIQKVGLVRFNPFKDTGGDQSFILALVDAKNTGVVISSLHTRTGTRWYAKGVVDGRGSDYELSEEEEKALKGSAFIAKEEKSKK